MKLWVICREESRNIPEDSLVINCNICRDKNTLTSLKVVLEEYGKEIEEIVYPKCELLKKVLNKK
ncbi:MAG TPA: hypothetical protein EYH15_00930 [Methanothermococcus okinawensis]|uniref:Uncharacterized protein n=1 Tax=Methanothermococcus okinawensis TaxID=155863 RepID=A0A832ZAL5_9EURY|nr:hypothetical protein [Methanococcaceae archaeon]HIP84043.1 hypothetical protein [Methanothermococcus okinawensis]HIP91352.1 hypothetical protein [Methanothermococcus okinawensis]